MGNKAVGWTARAAVLVAVGALAAVTVRPGLALEPRADISIAEGEWEGVMVSTSTVTAGGGGGAAAFSGELRFTSTAGMLDGEWTITGSGAMSGPDMSGTADYSGSGIVTGPSNTLTLQAVDLSIHMVITVRGVTQEMTMPMPPGESPFVIELASGSCGQIVGQWTATAEGLSAGGTVVLTRVGDLRPGTGADYMEQVTDLMVDAFAFKEGVFESASVDSSALNGLLDRAQNLQRALRRNDECGLVPEGGFAFLITETIQDLLEFALANPTVFSDWDLLSLTNAAVSAGVVGAGAIGESADGLESGLGDEWSSRLDGFIAAGDGIGIDIVAVAGELIGDADLAARAEAAHIDASE